MTGRFDLCEPEGTCYLATDPLSALLEVIGPDRMAGSITNEELAKRRLHELRIPRPHTVADLTARQAAGFGLTHEIHSHPRYELTQAWASRLRQAGAEGLLYLARHDPSPGRSVSLFGASGERRDWDLGDRSRIDEPELIERLWHDCRIRVIDRPRRDQIRVID